MDISAINSTVSASSAGASEGADMSVALPSSQQWSATQQDGMAFSQALEVDQAQAGEQVVGTSESSELSLADNVINKMQSLSTSAQEKGEELERLIVKATDTLNPSDVIAANRMMSEYYLENLMTAKLIGNATKAVERLTSLQ